ncbi:DUF3189 family protein [Dethiobacter alkaliphilus]|uniref:DUF3189 family protein n=1 Tax=Dethiobacter alkaliphilus TaxID=427926 RepID=UPI002227FF65|nr:DUF3189 family protein [Dethiobacter alkaliphilus]MCW3491505.1 DUF3189 family protein [Dethiobacter alkaliphilus]
MAGKKIIYHCYGGAHSSVTAAAIHLGKLKPHIIPSDRELMSLTLFDRQTKDGHGQLHFFGFDRAGNQVYSVGCRNIGSSLENFLQNVSGLLNVEDELHFVDTLHCVNLKMRIGGYISRRLGIIKYGRPLVLEGTQDAYPKLVELVNKVRKEAGA